MDASNIKEMHGNIYTAKVNGIIPWAGIQRPPQWVGGDPNPGSAFTVHEDGTYEIRRGYYFYKQVTTAGQPGMWVARTSSMDSETAIIAFSGYSTNHKDSFVVINMGKTAKDMSIEIKSSKATHFNGFVTSEDSKNLYSSIGLVKVSAGNVLYTAPPGSVTTFFAQ